MGRVVSEWLCPRRSTYANPENTYDYIWHRAHGRNMIWTNVFDVPLFKWKKFFGLGTNQTAEVPLFKWKKFFGLGTNQTAESKMMSFSDHEAVTSSLYLWRSII